MKLFKKFVAELIGTFGLVIFGCGVAVLLGLWGTDNQNLVVNDLVIALAFGLSIVCMAYSVGNVSGCHINPAVSFGVLISNYLKPKDKRNFSFVDFLIYVLAQIAGAFLAVLVLWAIFGKSNFGANQASDFLKNLSKDYYLIYAFAIETLLSTIFVFTILGVTSQEKSERRAGLVIGLTLTLVHIFGIPFTGTSVNPARSLAPAVFAYLFNNNVEPLNELWVYLAAPLLGALIAAFLYWLISHQKEEKDNSENKNEKVEEDKKEGMPVDDKKEDKPLKVEKQKEVEGSKKDKVEKMEIQRVSFETKLKKADKDLKKKYKTLQDELLAYGVKSRVSFNGDTYRLHKVEYAFITIRGKSIKLYLKLDPMKYKDSPIPVKDESSKKKYASTPAVIKVKSDLSVKRAIALIDETMNEAKILKKSEQSK